MSSWICRRTPHQRERDNNESCHGSNAWDSVSHLRVPVSIRNHANNFVSLELEAETRAEQPLHFCADRDIDVLVGNGADRRSVSVLLKQTAARLRRRGRGFA